MLCLVGQHGLYAEECICLANTLLPRDCLLNDRFGQIIACCNARHRVVGQHHALNVEGKFQVLLVFNQLLAEVVHERVEVTVQQHSVVQAPNQLVEPKRRSGS